MFHYKIEPNGDVSLRDLDLPTEAITLPASILPWLYVNLSAHPSVVEYLGERSAAPGPLCRTCGQATDGKI